MCIGFSFFGLFGSVRQSSSSSNLRSQQVIRLDSQPIRATAFSPHPTFRWQRVPLQQRKLKKDRTPRKKKQSKSILFYDKDALHYGFTNFSPHEVEYQDKIYPTSEHLFQSFKFLGHRPDIAERIRTCSSRPSVAFSEARRFHSEVRSDWMRINIDKMSETLNYKFAQHPDLKKELLCTGDAELIEDSPVDSFWGVGRNRDGRNELGKALMKLRSSFATNA